MFELFRRLNRLRFSFAVILTGTGAVGAILVLMPKDDVYASPHRLAQTVLLFAIIILAMAVSATLGRRMAEARLMLAYHAAPRPLAVAVQFLADERRLAARHMAGLMTGVLLCAELFVLSFWPQLSALAPLRHVLVGCGLAGAFGLLLLPIWRRTHWINALFLRSYLRQQARFIQFRPLTWRAARRRYRELTGPAVTPAGHTFKAGGLAWEWSDFTKGGVAIWGQSGSGKTICVLNALVEGLFLIHHKRGALLGGMIHDPKGDWRGRIERLCDRYGRRGDLYIFDITADPARAGAQDCVILNPLDTDDPPVEVAAALLAAMEQTGLKSADSFFPNAARILVTHLVVLLRAGLPDGQVPSVADLHRLANEPPPDMDAPEDEGQQRSSYFETLCAGIVRRWPDRTTLPQDVADALDYFLTEWGRNTPDRQRGGVIGTLSQLVSELMAEPARAFVTGKSTLTMRDVAAGGKLLCIHVRNAQYPRLAAILHTLAKRAGQAAVRRHVGKTVPSVFIADEFHTMFSAGPGADADFFSLSRESNHANIIACQNIPLFYQSARNRFEVLSLLGNATTQIFLRNDEPTTNEYASGLFGEMSTITISQSEAARLGDMFRRPHASYSRGAGSARVAPPAAFAALRIPTEEMSAPPYAEALVHLGTRAGHAGCLLLQWRVHAP